MKSFQTNIYNNSQLAGLDYEIYLIQQKLARITWMESLFGKAIAQIGKDGKTIYPQGKKFTQDIDLTFNDQNASYCFFVAEDPINISPKTDTDDWTDENVEIAQPIGLIFFGNMNKLENQSQEQLKTSLLFSLNKCPKIVLKICHEEISAVWKGFTITEGLKQFTKPPYYCLRVEMVVTYMAFPFNGNSQFNPSIYDNANKESIAINSSPGKSNLS